MKIQRESNREFSKNFKKISNKALEQYKKPEFINFDENVLQVIELMIKFFSTKEMQDLCRKIFTNTSDKTILFLENIDKKSFEILKREIDKFEKMIEKEFLKKENKKFLEIPNTIKHI
ncbi:MAG: hypothetical protein V1910_02370 [bacterium]